MGILDSPFTAKELADALAVVPTAATRKAAALRGRLELIVAAMAALNPSARPCDLAAAAMATLQAGGRLAQADEAAMREWIERIATEAQRAQRTERRS
jgi:hypothetical protein